MTGRRWEDSGRIQWCRVLLTIVLAAFVVSDEAKAVSMARKKTTTTKKNSSDQQHEQYRREEASSVLLESPHRESIGPAGAYYAFDGVDDYIVARDVQGLPSRTISACAWVFVNRHKSFNRIVSHEDYLGWNYTPTKVWRGLHAENKDLAPKVLLNRWHFVAERMRKGITFVDGAAGPQVPLEEVDWISMDTTIEGANGIRSMEGWTT